MISLSIKVCPLCWDNVNDVMPRHDSHSSTTRSPCLRMLGLPYPSLLTGVSANSLFMWGMTCVSHLGSSSVRL